jgi:hypothetical protein
MIRAVVEAVSNQAKEGIGTEMLASFWSNDGHGKTPQKNLKSFQGEGYFRIDVYEKATESARWLLRPVTLRELLQVDEPVL